MHLISLKKIHDGKYLKNYELLYLNKEQKIKKYEIVSRNNLTDANDLGKKASGVSIVAIQDQKLLLLKEFRMGINSEIYNLCAGMIEDGETIEECIKRELFEETGLTLKNIIKILPPSYSAPAISDISTYIAYVETEGEISDHSSANEKIQAGFYSPDEIAKMLKTGKFSSRSQMAAWNFINK